MRSFMKNLILRNLILALIIFLIPQALVFSQVFSVSEIDALNYPKLKVGIKALDMNETEFPNLSASDFVIKELVRGKAPFYPNDLELNCESQEIEPEASILLILDQSSSMNEIDSASGQKRWDWVKEGAITFINTIRFVGQTRIAITTFGRVVSLKCPFTNNRQELIDSINKIIVSGGTFYDPPFLDDVAGASVLLQQRPVNIRRIVVFLTDGRPEVSPKTDSIINTMRRANIQVYAITVTLPMESNLANISSATGGKSYAVFTKKDLSDIYRLIALDIQTKQFCYLTWTSTFGCDELSRLRDVEFIFKRIPAQKHLKQYMAPPHSIATVDVQNYISFGDPDPGEANAVVKDIVLKPDRSALNVTGVSFSPPETTNFKIIDWGGTLPPFTIDTGKTRTIKVQFTQTAPKDYRSATMIFVGEPCPPLITLVGGLSQVIILRPNGGEIFSTCDIVTIEWNGVDPAVQVKLSYSTDNGSSWTTITNTATGLTYNWKPPKEGTLYRIKAEVADNNSYLWAKRAGGKENDEGKSIAVQSDGMYFYVVGKFEGEARFDDKVLENRRGTDGFIAKYGNQGNVVWVERMASMNNDSANGVCVDDQGYAYVTGTCFKGTEFNLNTPYMQEADKSYCFVARYHPNGGTPVLGLIGATGFHTGFEAWGLRIRHENGITYVRGQYRGEIKYPDGKTLPKADPGIFTAEFDRDMMLRKIERDGTIYPDYSSTSARDNDGNLYQTGSFTGTRTFGKHILTSQGQNDVFVTKFGKVPGSQDISDGSFTIQDSKYQFSPATADLGNCVIGLSTTKVFTGILRNTGNIPIWIKKTEITGANADDFKVISGIDSVIMPGNSMSVEFSFQPTSMGTRTAQFVVSDVCAPPITLQLTGWGVCSGIPESPIEFVNVNVGKDSEKLINCIFRNTNNTIIRISPKVEGDNAPDFQLLDPQTRQVITGSLPVNPGGCLELIVRFVPQAHGERKAIINFHLPDGCEYIESVLLGFGVDTDIEVTDIDWGRRRILTVNDTLLVIKNNSTLPAKLVKVEFETTDITEFSFGNIDLTILGKSSANLQLSFTPQDEFNYENRLLLTFDVLDKPIPIKLTGSGILPRISTQWICDNPARPGEESTAYLVIDNRSTSADLYISSIDFVNPTQHYSWVTGTAPRDIIVKMQSDVTIPVRFHPKNAGTIIEQIRVLSDASPGPDKNPLVEEIVEAKCDALGIAVDTPVDFRKWLLCETGFRGVQIYNTAGTTPIYISDYYFIGEDSIAFTPAIPPDFEVPARGQKEFYVLFNPKEQRRYRAELHLLNSINESLVVELIGEGSIIHLYTPEKKIEKEPGYFHKLPVYAKIDALDKRIVTNIALEVIYNKNMVRYLNTPNSITNRLNNWTWELPIVKDGVLEIKGSGSLQTPFNNELFSLDFDIYLGEVEQSNIYFKPLHDECFVGDTLGTTVRLTNVCFLGGRLIKMSKTMYNLSTPTPNPVSDIASFEFGVALDGHTRIELINSVGSIQKVLVDEYLNSGVYRLDIDSNELSSGVYILRMNSGPFREAHKLIIAK